MSYLIWWLIGGRDRYPKGVSWFLLSLVRLLDWAAFIGLSLFITVQVAGFAVDARSYMHYKEMQHDYEIDISNIISRQVSNDPNVEHEETDIGFENYRRTEKQRAMYGWYGKMLVLEEKVWDQWRTLFNYDAIIWEEKSLIPFFWLNGADNYSNSMSELDGYYTYLGMDGRAGKWTQDISDYYSMSNLYDTTASGYMSRVLKNKNATKAQWDTFHECSNTSGPQIMSQSMREMKFSRGDLAYFQTVSENYNKSKALLAKSTKCIADLQDELGVKRYPTQDMLGYNQSVIDYKDAILKDAIVRAKSEKGNNPIGVPLYNTYDLDWETRLYRKYILKCEIECEEAQVPEDWNKPYVRGAIKVTPFYDVVVNNNPAYKD
ncbi:MAG: hypothetical protein J6N72_10670 [Psychrobacter sp.]|nr:hypothetical protein [Psychrobacter sp.]